MGHLSSPAATARVVIVDDDDSVREVIKPFTLEDLRGAVARVVATI